MKILVIEDSEDDRILYSRALKRGDDALYDIIEAEDGETGLQELGKGIPDCILLDYSLPGQNGLDVLKAVRSSWPFVPVVMLTGQGNEAIAVSAIHAGAQDYITKSSITPEALKNVIRNAVENCALQQRVHDQRLALEIFTRALAHDLKEPVRTIRSFLDIMATREEFSESGKTHFNYIQKAAERMNRLIETVYYYIRLDGAPEHMAEELCDMNEVLHEVKENIGKLISENKAEITNDVLPVIMANRMQMLQILQNLLVNSIRHADSIPKIHISVSEEGERWQFKVTDNGPGIKPEYQSLIFSPFKRLSSLKEQGLGLGLAISKKIIESYGGKIWYESAPQKGAVFAFTMPKMSASDIKPQQADATLENATGYMANILLVEDNEADIELTKAILFDEARLKCDFQVARNGFEAMELLKSVNESGRKIDLILLDINMPGMDGFELLQRLQGNERLQNIPVIMCTTSTYDKDMDRARSLGAIGYVNKPTDITKLQSALSSAANIRLLKDDSGYKMLRTAP